MSESRGGQVWNVLAWSLWLLLLAAWTVGLLTPLSSNSGETVISPSLQFWVGKSLHVGAYAFLALLTCRLISTWRLRWTLWAALLAHATLTEVGQNFVEGRSGRVADVFIDATGLSLGALAGVILLRDRRPPPQKTQEPPALHPSLPASAAHPDDVAPSGPSD
jgi:VanZ family protein